MLFFLAFLAVEAKEEVQSLSFNTTIDSYFRARSVCTGEKLYYITLLFSVPFDVLAFRMLYQK